MKVQKYTDRQARQWMAEGNCPECGHSVGMHGYWGGPGCSLHTNGVIERISVFRVDMANNSGLGSSL